MTGEPVTPDETEIMSRYGIRQVLVPQYHYRSWHYSKLSDAVAQAKRIGDVPDAG